MPSITIGLERGTRIITHEEIMPAAFTTTRN